jgi:hypothetical protein
VKLESIAPDAHAFEFRFDPSLLDRLASIYENVVVPQLDVAKRRTYFGRGKVSGDGLRFHVSKHGHLLVWVSADDLPTHREFEEFFDALGLADAVKPLIDFDERIVMYNGFYVVSDGVVAPSWHTDYADGAHAYTLLTPLYELDSAHGQLWYKSGDQIMRYEYRHGVGVLVGEGFMHATEPFPTASRQRVLVSLTFGTDRMEHWPVLEETVGAQSPFVVLPSGLPRT